MPTHILAQVSVPVVDALPRNRVVITPCFRHSTEFGLLSGPDFDSLADDLANGFWTWAGSPGEVRVKLYNLAGQPPHDPVANRVVHEGVIATYDMPRELSICLSFSGGPNRPWNRGRLYLPAKWSGVTSGSIGLRPTTTQMAKAGALVSTLAGLGGANVDWIVWSRKLAAATRVERWFVDDEWDIQRRRGMKPTTRSSGTTSG